MRDPKYFDNLPSQPRSFKNFGEVFVSCQKITDDKALNADLTPNTKVASQSQTHVINKHEDHIPKVCSEKMGRESETRISQREVRVHPTRISTPKCEVRVSPSEYEARVQPLAKPKCEFRVQPLAKPKCKVHISLPERETRIEEQGLFKCDLRISRYKYKVCIN